GRLRVGQTAVQGVSGAVLAVHLVDDAALRGDLGAALPRRHTPGPGRYLSWAVAATGGESVQHLLDEAVHTDVAHRTAGRCQGRRRRRGEDLLGSGVALGQAGPGVPRHHHLRPTVELLRLA